MPTWEVAVCIKRGTYAEHSIALVRKYTMLGWSITWFIKSINLSYEYTYRILVAWKCDCSMLQFFLSLPPSLSVFFLLIFWGGFCTEILKQFILMCNDFNFNIKMCFAWQTMMWHKWYECQELGLFISNGNRHMKQCEKMFLKIDFITVTTQIYLLLFVSSLCLLESLSHVKTMAFFFFFLIFDVFFFKAQSVEK